MRYCIDCGSRYKGTKCPVCEENYRRSHYSEFHKDTATRKSVPRAVPEKKAAKTRKRTAHDTRNTFPKRMDTVPKTKPTQPKSTTGSKPRQSKKDLSFVRLIIVAAVFLISVVPQLFTMFSQDDYPNVDFNADGHQSFVMGNVPEITEAFNEDVPYTISNQEEVFMDGTYSIREIEMQVPIIEGPGLDQEQLAEVVREYCFGMLPEIYPDTYINPEIYFVEDDPEGKIFFDYTIVYNDKNKIYLLVTESYSNWGDIDLTLCHGLCLDLKKGEAVPIEDRLILDSDLLVMFRDKTAEQDDEGFAYIINLTDDELLMLLNNEHTGIFYQTPDGYVLGYNYITDRDTYYEAGTITVRLTEDELKLHIPN